MVSLGAGESKGVPLVVVPKMKPPKGAAKRYDFTVKATPTGAPTKAKVITGSLEHRALLPRWAIPVGVVAMLLLCCGMAAVVGVLIFGEEVKIWVETQIAKGPATQTAEAADTTPPTVDITHSPEHLTQADKITFTATASDPGGVRKIQILVNAVRVKECPSSPCVYEGGPYPDRTSVSYGANAWDTAGNRGWTGYKRISLAPAEMRVTLTSIAAESGSVFSDGTVSSNLWVGDDPPNRGRQAFLSFDISGIPAGSTILDVVVDFSDYGIIGDPFGSPLGDGCLMAYPHDYGTLGPEDYFAGWPTGAIIRWCSTGELNSPRSEPYVKSALQGKVGTPRFQLRLQFKPPETDGDGAQDTINFGSIKLMVTYRTP
jgi:hypothetical protein